MPVFVRHRILYRKMGRKKKVADVVYSVQSEVNKNEFYNFTERPVLCDSMSKITGNEWSKDSLDYHFTRKKETEFTYKGYTIFMRKVQRGKRRGISKQQDRT